MTLLAKGPHVQERSSLDNPKNESGRATVVGQIPSRPRHVASVRRSGAPTSPERTTTRLSFPVSPPRIQRGLRIQAKLSVGAVNDPFEVEADRVADEVMRTIDKPTRRETLPLHVQSDVGRTRVRMKTWPVDAGDVLGLQGGNVEGETEAAIQRARGAGKPLDHGVRRSMEHGFGADLSRVRIHDNGAADTISRKIQAEAFTTGSDIFFRGGSYQPSSRSGQRLIAHEVTHVMQQKHAESRDTAPRVKARQVDTSIRRQFSGVFAGKTLRGVQALVPSITYTQFQALSKTDTVYSTPEEVIAGLAALTSSSPTASAPTASVAAPSPAPAPIPSKSPTAEAPAPAPVPAPAAKSGNPAVVPAGYTYKGTRSGLVLYRADGRRPGQILQKKGFTPKDFPTMAEVVASIRQSPSGFAQSHVSNNRSDVTSTASSDECGGYFTSGRYRYTIVYGPTIFEYLPPDPDGKGSSSPKIFTDGTGDGAKMVGFDPRKSTEEIDFFVDIDLRYITRYEPYGGKPTPIDWSGVNLILGTDPGDPNNYP